MVTNSYAHIPSCLAINLECAQNAYDKSFYGREDASENDADEVANG